MVKTLLVYSPFCSPCSPPYSITNIAAFLEGNLPDEHVVSVLDLNIKFHNLAFPKFHKYYSNMTNNYNAKEYDKITSEYSEMTRVCYSKNNKLIRQGEIPQYFNEMLDLILKEKPDYVAFSIVFSSQSFYTYSLVKKLNELGISTIIGGPAINDQLRVEAGSCLANELELLNYITGKENNHKTLNFDTYSDFSIYDYDDYFTPKAVIPIRTSTSCYYRKCAFCTHYMSNSHYYEYPIEKIKNIVVKSKIDHVFFVDDMIHKKRLLELATMLKPLNVKWLCQLKPTEDLDYETLKILAESGLKEVLWGFESASQRILDLMCKGTKIDVVSKVLSDSHKAGIKNITFTMFGFPSETHDEFMETIHYLEDNSENIDLVAVSIFGLQKGTDIYKNPEKYSITKINEKSRSILDPVISFELSSGLNTSEATALRKKYQFVFDKVNNYPMRMNFFREHMLCLLD